MPQRRPWYLDLIFPHHDITGSCSATGSTQALAILAGGVRMRSTADQRLNFQVLTLALGAGKQEEREGSSYGQT